MKKFIIQGRIPEAMLGWVDIPEWKIPSSLTLPEAINKAIELQADSARNEYRVICREDEVVFTPNEEERS